MTILVVGATGATGRLLVKQLLDRGMAVRVIVRSPEKLPAEIRDHSNLTVIQGSVLTLDDATLAQQVRGCEVVASCLGHNITLKGLYGPPHRLVTDTTRRLCAAIKATRPDQPVRFVLMNTTANRNRDLDEPASVAQRGVLALLRLVLPPQADNEHAADYLRVVVGQHDPAIEWVAVRPDTLIDEAEVTAYEVHASPTRSAVFDPGKTSRINVGHFMADLIADLEIWNRWKGQMPVLYNKG